MNTKTKMLVLFAIFAALAIACSLTPVGTEVPVVPGNLDTMVALTLAAIDTNTPGQQSDTPQDTVAVSPTNTPEPSQTPTSTNTLQPTATSTQLPSGIDELNLGAADWSTNFDQKYPFHTYTASSDGGRSETEVKNGKYYFKVFEKISYSIWVFAALQIEDYYLEVTVEMPDACGGKDRAGLIFGTPSDTTGEGYLYQISCDGHYRLTAYDGSQTINLTAWEESSELNVGPGKSNKIGVLVKDDKITMYINGEKVDQVNDTMYTAGGKFGFSIGVDNNANFVVKFDDAAYWNIP